MNPRIFAVTTPAGVIYADRETLVRGDYKLLAVLPHGADPVYQFDCPAWARAEIAGDVARIRTRRGAAYVRGVP